MGRAVGMYDRHPEKGRNNIPLRMGWLVALSLLLACARVVTPEGGPKDSTPPRIARMTPGQGTVNFKEKRIRFRFNEFVRVQEPEKHLLISPPLKHRVYPLIKGKTVEIPLRDTLREGTTYVVDFGSSIVDLTEGNRLGEFHYVFSTGPSIDTCYLRGRARDALLHTPIAGTKILLYRGDQDSLPYLQPPDFWARCDGEGLFTVRNLPNESLRIVALVETNNNMLLDKKDELIALCVERVQPTCSRMPSLEPESAIQPRTDSLAGEEANTRAHRPESKLRSKDGSKGISSRAQGLEDSLLRVRKDSAVQHEFSALTLDLFASYRPPQLRLRQERPRADRIRLIFSCPPEGPITLELNDFPGCRTVVERDALRDTVSFWLMDTLPIQTDTLQARLLYSAQDSLGRLVPRVDSLRFIFTEKRKRAQKGRREGERIRPVSAPSDSVRSGQERIKALPQDSVNVNPLDTTGRPPINTTQTAVGATASTTHHQRERDTVLAVALSVPSAPRILPGDTIWITCKDVPVRIAEDGLRIIRRADSAVVPHRLLRDSSQPRRLGLVGALADQTSYRVAVDSGALVNVWGVVNRGQTLELTTENPLHYAQLHLHMEGMPPRVLIEVITREEKPKVVRQAYFEGGAGNLTVPYMPPGEYGIRLIDDRDGNHRWSPGNYLLRRPCEPVRYFKDRASGGSTVKVRANWEYDLSIDYRQLEP